MGLGLDLGQGARVGKSGPGFGPFRGPLRPGLGTLWAYFGGYRSISKDMDLDLSHLGPILVGLGHSGPFLAFWWYVPRFEPFWAFQGSVPQFGPFMAYFEKEYGA